MTMNSIALVGRLACPPEARPISNGTVCRLRLAVDRRRGDTAMYIDVDTFGPVAAACQEHLRTGRKIAVLGRLEQDVWDGPDGTKRSKHRVAASTVEFLDRRAP
jgi:single-strand DNA-binding protein